MSYFAGLDWASAAHALCVTDESGSIIDTFSVEHSVSGLSTLLRRLARVASPSELEIAIERPSGLLVDTLLAGGHRVVPVHPNILKATRSRYSMAGGKSDPADAFILADLLRTDGHRFRRLQPLSDQIRALRALVRSREDLLAHRIRLANQLRSVLESFWPGALLARSHTLRPRSPSRRPSPHRRLSRLDTGSLASERPRRLHGRAHRPWPAAARAAALDRQRASAVTSAAAGGR
jgi:transposase